MQRRMRRSKNDTWTPLEMESRTWAAIFPLLYGLRKIALIGIPSLAVIGLAGLAGWKWIRKSDTGSAIKLTNDGDPPKESQDVVDSVSGLKRTPDDASFSTSTSCIETGADATCAEPVQDRLTCDSTSRETAACCDVQANLDSCELESSSVASSEDSCKDSTDVAVPRVLPGSSVAGESASTSQRVELRSEQRTFRCARVQAVVNIPKHLVGRFIGRQGRNVKSLRAESGGAYIYVDQGAAGEGPFVPCFVHGEQAQVEEALRLISYKYPNISVPSDLCARNWPGEETSSGYDSSSPTNGVRDPLANAAQDPPANPWAADLVRTTPPPSPFHGMVTYIESVKKVWILPLDATQHVEELHRDMNSTYLHTSPLPLTCPQANVGTFCAVGIDSSHWLRGVVLQISPDGQTCDICLVDYGSCVVVATTSLRPLR